MASPGANCLFRCRSPPLLLTVMGPHPSLSSLPRDSGAFQPPLLLLWSLWHHVPAHRSTYWSHTHPSVFCPSVLHFIDNAFPINLTADAHPLAREVPLGARRGASSASGGKALRAAPAPEAAPMSRNLQKPPQPAIPAFFDVKEDDRFPRGAVIFSGLVPACHAARMARKRNVTISARVQVLSGLNVFALVPLVMPFATAQSTAS